MTTFSHITAGLTIAALLVPTTAVPDRTTDFTQGKPGTCSLDTPLDPDLSWGEDFDLDDAPDLPADDDGKWLRGEGNKHATICIQTGPATVTSWKVRPNGYTKPIHLEWGTVLYWIETNHARSSQIALSLDDWG